MDKKSISVMKINRILLCLQNVRYEIVKQFELDDDEKMAVIHVFPNGRRINWGGADFAREKSFRKKTKGDFVMTIDTRPKGSPMPLIYLEWLLENGLDEPDLTEPIRA